MRVDLLFPEKMICKPCIPKLPRSGIQKRTLTSRLGASARIPTERHGGYAQSADMNGMQGLNLAHTAAAAQFVREEQLCQESMIWQRGIQTLLQNG